MPPLSLLPSSSIYRPPNLPPPILKPLFIPSPLSLLSLSSPSLSYQAGLNIEVQHLHHIRGFRFPRTSSFSEVRAKMMMAEITEHKRGAHDSFLLGNPTTLISNHSSQGGGNLCDSSRSEKRPKSSAGRGSTNSAKDKKDKIGERVAKLQQLVSPFGKSDTASVLQEATAYIKFLHDQLQVLSAPYLQPTGTGKIEAGEYYSLRSRGLCLVPVASTVRIAQDNGADIWAPTNSGRNFDV